MDANDTRYHLVQGESDWLRTRRTDVAWDGVRHEVTLWPHVFRFTTTARRAPLDIGARRGAARDAFGNWYWIAPDAHSILVRSSGSGQVSTFWPVACDDACAEHEAPGFHPATSAARPVVTLAGLAVTEDHYLVVGSEGPVGAAGILVFDLYGSGAPRLRTWPVPFEPFDMAAREGGGVWVLTRPSRAWADATTPAGVARIWELGPSFEVVLSGSDAPPAPANRPHFGNLDGTASRCTGPVGAISSAHGWAVPGTSPIAIAPLGSGVLVLDRDDGSGFGRVHLLEGGRPRGTGASLAAMLEHVDVGRGEDDFTLVAHDCALGQREPDDPDAWLGRLYVAGQDGNQVYAFGVAREGDQLVLDAQPDYYPMRLFGGCAIVAAGGEPFYDSNGAWLPLQKQRRPRYVETGELSTPVFDSGVPACVWHRLMLDACIPPGARVDVLTRASDDWRDLTRVEWLSPLEQRAFGISGSPSGANVPGALADWRTEPSPRMRGDGSELPFTPRESGDGRGTWELLFQEARGRYLQIKLVLSGDGRRTPRVRALRAWYPRFSYLNNYLPAVYREDPQSASFLDRFLANIEGMLTSIEDRIAAAQMLFDVASAPPEALDWLGRWFGVALDPSWEDSRRRLFLRHAMEFFAARGTIRGLQLALRLTLDDCVDDRLFQAPNPATRSAMPIRIVERFRSRRTTPVGTRATTPAAMTGNGGSRWTPSQGRGELNRLYQDALGLASSDEFPVSRTNAPTGWSTFAERVLGFVPSGGAGHLDRWQSFLARRYRSAQALNDAWKTDWPRFTGVGFPDRLPSDGAALTDWFEFEGTVLAMQRTAHRFTVMLPVRPHTRADSPARLRRLALAKKVLDLERPAHTVYDTRFYWAMFRLGEARLGDDTLLDRGSRSPELMAPMVLGEGYLAESFLSAPPGLDAPDRLQLGRDRLGRSSRVGGP